MWGFLVLSLLAGVGLWMFRDEVSWLLDRWMRR